MGKLINLNPLEFSGKVGNSVGVCGPNGHYLRSLPKKSSKMPTERQLACRARLKMVIYFLLPLKALLEEVYHNHQNKRMTVYNLAVSEMLKTAITGDYPNQKIDYPKVVISKGKLPAPYVVKAERDNSGDLLVTWENFTRNSDYCFTPGDPVIVIYDARLKQHRIVRGVRTPDSQSSLRVENLGSGPVHIWILFTYPEKKTATGSIYLGCK